MSSRRGNGEGSIYRRDDGLWVGALDLGWREGKRVRKVVSSKSRGEVVRRMRALQPSIAQGVKLAPDRLTVGQYLDGWLTDRIPGTVTPRTEVLYERAVTDYIVPSLGRIRLNQLTPSDVSQMLRDMEARGYSPSTRRMARATLRRALRMAEQDGLLIRNVASIAEGPKMNQREGRSLTPEQARTILAAVRGHRHEAAYVIAISLGLRRGEILGLSWSDVERAEGTVVIHVRRQLVRNKSGLHLVDLKTAGSKRTLHLSAPLVEVLDRHRRRQEAEELVGGVRWRNEHELVFTSNIGTPLDPEAFGRTVPKICEEAGLGHWSIHELRHSCASLLLAQEVPLEVVAEQLGHVSIRVTKDVYGHLMPRSRARAAEAMRAILYDDSPSTMPQTSHTLATPMATPRPFEDRERPTPDGLTRSFVGRPGLDPGTLGLKVPCSSR